MTKTLIKASALACVLAGFAFAGPAYAMSPVPVNGADRIAIPVADEEVDAVEEDMRPDVMAPGPKSDEAMPEGEAMQPADKNKDIGEEEIERDMGKPEQK
ncbi:MAG TPA: hypothetical protein VNO69_11715 [Methyloceanibacter sp.]|nr:hypothetical protein [Methyloceanibacter sp.]